MTEINKEQITFIKQYNKLKNTDLAYISKPVKNWYGRTTGYESGYQNILYFMGGRTAISPFEHWNKEYKNTLIEVRQSVFYKPHLEITLFRGEIITKYFQTLKELIEWREKNLEGLNLIEI